MLPLKTLAIAAIAVIVATGSSTGASAESYWDATHPRRDEVNDRLANQNSRIDQERRSGEIGRGEARQLHREDHRIRNEERRMAARDGGHITRYDQRVLNRQENAVSHQIGNARR
jgi:hypothetical protein